VGDELSEVPQPAGLTQMPAVPGPTAFQETPMPAPVAPNAVATPPEYSEDFVDQPGNADLPDYRPPPMAQVYVDEPRRHEPATVTQIMAQIRGADASLYQAIVDFGQDKFPAVGAPGFHALDPVLHARILQDYIKSVGATGVTSFIALQTALHALNAKYGRVYNPFYMMVPGIPPSRQPVALDVDDRVHTDVTLTVGEEAARQQARVTGGPLSTTLEMNIYGPSATFADGELAVTSVRSLTEAALGSPDPKLSGHLEPVDFGNGIVRLRPNIASMFDSGGRPLPKFAAGSPGRATQANDADPLAHSSFLWKEARGAVPSSFNAEDELYGNVTEDLDDDLAYVPLVFTDLRPDPTGRTRRVYFRALNVSSGESFNPNWSEEEAWGRVDPVLGYRSTNRSISLSFTCHAFSPEDLPVMYRKRQWLTSMVYPEISPDLLMKSGPVIRLRLGDLYNNANGGLAGVLKSVEFDDSEQTWELRRGYKVPRGFNVSVNFQVLHEGTPGIHQGHFTVMRAVIPQRSPSDPDRFSKISAEPADGLFSAQKLRRRVR
jgi:hypothetical protein